MSVDGPCDRMLLSSRSTDVGRTGKCAAGEDVQRREVREKVDEGGRGVKEEET